MIYLVEVSGNIPDNAKDLHIIGYSEVTDLASYSTSILNRIREYGSCWANDTSHSFNASFLVDTDYNHMMKRDGNLVTRFLLMFNRNRKIDILL